MSWFELLFLSKHAQMAWSILFPKWDAGLTSCYPNALVTLGSPVRARCVFECDTTTIILMENVAIWAVISVKTNVRNTVHAQMAWSKFILFPKWDAGLTSCYPNALVTLGSPVRARCVFECDTTTIILMENAAIWGVISVKINVRNTVHAQTAWAVLFPTWNAEHTLLPKCSSDSWLTCAMCCLSVIPRRRPNGRCRDLSSYFYRNHHSA